MPPTRREIGVAWFTVLSLREWATSCSLSNQCATIQRLSKRQSKRSKSAVLTTKTLKTTPSSTISFCASSTTKRCTNLSTKFSNLISVSWKYSTLVSAQVVSSYSFPLQEEQKRIFIACLAVFYLNTRCQSVGSPSRGPHPESGDLLPHEYTHPSEDDLFDSSKHTSIDVDFFCEKYKIMLVLMNTPLYDFV